MLGHFYFGSFRGGMLLTRETGCWQFLTKEQFDAFIKGELPEDSRAYQGLEADGFCSRGSDEVYIRDNVDEIRSGSSYLFEATSLFIFAVTNECNNRCVYCQANGCGALKRMTEEVAEMALQRIAGTPARSITIEFQGGEPLMNFPVIKYIVLNAKRLLPGKEVQFTLVSNLSLMTDEIACFLRDHKVSVSTSLDGNRELHDWNRPAADHTSSFDNMLLGREKLERLGMKTGAIQTTTAKALDHPEKILRTYAELGYNQIFLRPLTRLGSAARRWDEIGYTPAQFLSFYHKAMKEIINMNREGIPMVEYHAALLLSKIMNGRALNYMELRSPCGAGLGQVAITANGNVYTCDEGRMIAETGDDAFLLGNVLENSYDDWMNSSCCKAVCSASLLETLPGCCDCVYKPYCGVCPVVNYAINGSITRISRDRCAVYKGMLDMLFGYLIDGNEEIIKLFQTWSDSI